MVHAGLSASVELLVIQASHPANSMKAAVYDIVAWRFLWNDICSDSCLHCGIIGSRTFTIPIVRFQTTS